MSEDSSILDSISNLNDTDYRTIAEAAIVYLHDEDKLERLSKLNQSLVQVDNCKEIAKWLLKTVSLVLRQGIDETKLAKYFQTNFGLDEQKANVLKELCDKHWTQLKKKLENQNLMISQLVDMEWNFGVTASTNYIDKLGNAFLQLKLVYNKGGILETSFMEITLPQFYAFLHEMNKAKSQMDYLS